MVGRTSDRKVELGRFLNGDTPNDAPTVSRVANGVGGSSRFIMDSMLLARIIRGVGVSYRARSDGVNLNYHLSLIP
jgi:hypothetical protein